MCERSDSSSQTADVLMVILKVCYAIGPGSVARLSVVQLVSFCYRICVIISIYFASRLMFTISLFGLVAAPASTSCDERVSYSCLAYASFLLIASPFEQGGNFNLRRRLVDTEVLYVVTVPGNTFEGIFQSINHFQNNYQEVARSLEVSDDEVSYFLFRSAWLRYNPPLPFLLCDKSHVA